MEEKTLVKYFRSLGLTVNRSTKARGHQGFYLKNRIDVSRNTPPHRVVPTLLHEFAHYVHAQIEPDMPKTGGTFTALFKEENKISSYEKPHEIAPQPEKDDDLSRSEAEMELLKALRAIK